MEITSFTISKDRKNLNLTIIDAASVTSLSLYTNKTYRDPNEAIDLTSKLGGLATENLTITLADVNQSYFDGLYFVETEDPTEVSKAIVADTTRYKECIVDKAKTLLACDECLKENSPEIIASDTILRALIISVESGFVEEAFNIVKGLDILCSDACKTCGDYSNNTDLNYFTTSTN